MQKVLKSWDAVQNRLKAWRRLKRIKNITIKQSEDGWVVQHEENK